MKKKIIVSVLILLIHPVSILAFTWSHVLNSDFEGGRHGQLDAYRHALASATVSYTLGSWAVDLTTQVFESRGKDSNKMDAHNNKIGAEIGSKVKSFHDIEPAIHKAVTNGTANSSNPEQITWLPPSRWHNGKLW